MSVLPRKEHQSPGKDKSYNDIFCKHNIFSKSDDHARKSSRRPLYSIETPRDHYMNKLRPEVTIPNLMDLR